MSNTQGAVALLRFQLQFAHQWMEGTLQGLTPDIAHWQPGGKVHPIAAEIVHIVTSEDFIVSVVIKGGAPLMATAYAGKAGFGEPPPPGNRDAWAATIRVDLDALQAYRQAVWNATDECLATLTDADLERQLDMTALGVGVIPISAAFNLLILNTYCHTGEISCIKGMKGLQGYPM